MNPREFREVGHRVVDLLASYLEQIEEKLLFPDVEPSVFVTNLVRTANPLAAGSLAATQKPPRKLLFVDAVPTKLHLDTLKSAVMPLGVVAD